MAILFMQNNTSHFSLHSHLVLVHSSEVLRREEERAKSFPSALQSKFRSFPLPVSPAVVSFESFFFFESKLWLTKVCRTRGMSHTNLIPFANWHCFLVSVCLFYRRVSGLSPFMGDNDNETLANVTSATWDFDDEAFDEISDDAKDFISNLLKKDMK